RQGTSTPSATPAASSINARSCSSRRRRKRLDDEPPFLCRPLTNREPTFEATRLSPSKTPTAWPPSRTSTAATTFLAAAGIEARQAGGQLLELARNTAAQKGCDSLNSQPGQRGGQKRHATVV